MSGRKPPASIPFILDFLAREYPDARILLDYKNPFQLLIATVLAAQCTDERVNRVTPALFRDYPDPQALASAPLKDLEEAVRTTGFYRSKAQAIRGIAASIVERHGGNVPDTMESLTALPGVGRKTSSVILGSCFAGCALPVDTHVARVSFRLGMTASKNPVKIEQDLASAVPKDQWWRFATQLGWHGRRICVALKPKCSVCGLAPVCPRNGVTRSA